MSKIKLYDDRDFDYYNPRPFILNMLSLLGTDDHEVLYNWVSSNVQDFFTGKVITIEKIDTMPSAVLDQFVKNLKNVVDRKAENLENEVRSLESSIEEYDVRINNLIEAKNRTIEKLARLKDVIAKSSRANN